MLLSRIFNAANMSSKGIRENKILAKISEFSHSISHVRKSPFKIYIVCEQEVRI